MTLSAHFLAVSSALRRLARAAARLEQCGPEDIRTTGVPLIVRSFVERAVPAGRVPNVIRFRQVGEMRSDPGGAWHLFSAEQMIAVYRPGFLWRARMSLAPFVSLHIVDAYDDGQGWVEARLFGSVRVARALGPMVSQGELMRYLAELPWVAPAMLHNRELSWRGLSPTTVEVSATSVAGPSRLRLGFENGDIMGVEADDRPRATGRHFVPTRWVARYASYQEFDGWRIPTRAEVSWIPKEGGFACWRGQVTDYMAV